MKKIRTLTCTFLLAVCLVGNVFAGNTTSGGIYDLFNDIYETTITLFSFTDEDCPPRQCNSCRPDDKTGNCRPPRD